ncbi:MAG: hypothetical protein ACK526_23110 [Planctomyces sp.]
MAEGTKAAREFHCVERVSADGAADRRGRAAPSGRKQAAFVVGLV